MSQTLSLMLSSFQRILLPLGFTDFSVRADTLGRDDPPVVMFTAYSPTGKSTYLAFGRNEIAETRSPFALVAARLAHYGIITGDAA